MIAATLMIGVAPAYAGRVFIDPGHGGPYPGAIQGGVAEDTVNLAIASTLKSILANRGHKTLMSRTSDVSPNLKDIATWHYIDDEARYYADGMTGVYNYDGSSGGIPYDDLQARCDKANSFGADVFVSIHCDSVSSSSARGTATYRNWDNETDHILSQRLAECVQSEMMDATTPYYSMQDDGTKAVGFYVIRWANMPSILIESAFLSNTYERSLLTSSLFRLRLARGIANGIEKFLASNPFTPRFDRIYGENRFDTAVRIADTGWAGEADTVLLASGRTWPDALAATPLSAKLDAPLLLTNGGSLSPETAAALARYKPTSVVVLGGDAAVSEDTALAAAEAAGIAPDAIRRIAGRTRFETSALIAKEVGVSDAGVVLVGGANYPDALSASSFANERLMPILLTEVSSVPSSVASFMIDNDEALDRAVVVGGSAVVGNAIVAGLKAGTLGPSAMTVKRLAGSDRYSTNIAVINEYWGTGTIRPYVATGSDFPDALGAGTLAGRNGEPLMLLGSRQMTGKTREFLANNEERVPDLTMIGGPVALPYLMDWEIEKGLAR